MLPMPLTSLPSILSRNTSPKPSPRAAKAAPQSPPNQSADWPDGSVKAPNALLVALEARAPWEYAAMWAATPWLARAPRGDGHPVLVLPGLGANDFSTIPLRNYLAERGYRPSPWHFGMNLGARTGVVRGCVEHVRELYEAHGQRVSLVGWSLGGIYAREIAKEVPEMTRCVITLGTPFTGPAHATNARRFYEAVSGHRTDDPHMRARIRQAPPVPTTSIYSKTDGVVAWQCSINPESPLTENVEVQASHIGLGFNPVALYVVAERLAQPADPTRWRKFEASRLQRWLFGTGTAFEAPHFRVAPGAA